jgi:hypothetical protein
MARQAGQAVTSFEVRRQFVNGDTVCSIIDWVMAIPGVWIDRDDQFIEKAGRFYVCPICFNERELHENELVDNAELKGASPLMEFAAEGATTFTYCLRAGRTRSARASGSLHAGSPRPTTVADLGHRDQPHRGRRDRRGLGRFRQSSTHPTARSVAAVAAWPCVGARAGGISSITHSPEAAVSAATSAIAPP